MKQAMLDVSAFHNQLRIRVEQGSDLVTLAENAQVSFFVMFSVITAMVSAVLVVTGSDLHVPHGLLQTLVWCCAHVLLRDPWPPNRQGC